MNENNTELSQNGVQSENQQRFDQPNGRNYQKQYNNRNYNRQYYYPRQQNRGRGEYYQNSYNQGKQNQSQQQNQNQQSQQQQSPTNEEQEEVKNPNVQHTNNSSNGYNPRHQYSVPYYPYPYPMQMNPYTLQRMPPYDYQAYQMYPYPPFMPIPGRGPRHPYYSNNQGWMNKPYQYNQPTKEDQTQEDENNEAQVPIQLDKDLLSEQKKYPQIVDIGVNLLHPSFRNDLEKVIRRSFSKHVKPLVVTGTSVKSSQNAIALAEKYEGLYTTCGVHPHESSSCNSETLATLESLASKSKVVAIGECGLDFNRMYSPQDVQELWFEEQLKLAIKLKKPLFLHERDAHESFLKILNKYKGQLPPAVVHCFTGTKEEVEKYLELGFYIGFTGVICNKKRGKHLRDIISSKLIPLSRIMIETDAPFMTPLNMPVYNGRNEPCNLTYVLKTLAECYQESEETLARATTENALKFFNIPTAS